MTFLTRTRGSKRFYRHNLKSLEWSVSKYPKLLIPAMNLHTCPGQGPSLGQLIFTLNEKLRYEPYSSSYVTKDCRCPQPERRSDFLHSLTFDQVCQLDQDASTALAAIREWRNSLVPVNRFPFEILSLIPAYLPSPDDRLRASFVCRRWRKTFVQCPGLWSELSLSNDEAYVQTFLERAQRSMLDISADDRDPAINTWPLLSSHTEQIRCLHFVCHDWLKIKEFADIMSGPLPFLHALTINDKGPLNPYGLPDSSWPLFSNALNLKIFRFHGVSEWSPPLDHFVFPNLVSFDFSANSDNPFETMQLLDFLEASPMLQTVQMTIVANTISEDIPQERVVDLPNVESFTLVLGDCLSTRKLGYGIVGHISCPSVRFTSFVQMGDPTWDIPPVDLFPDSIAWDAIFSRYTTNTIEEVTLKITTYPSIGCEIVLQSPDASIIELRLKTSQENPQHIPPTKEFHNIIFTQATRAILDYPQLKKIRRLRICHNFGVDTDASHISNDVRQLFGSLGHLDELEIYDCDVYPYLCHLNQTNDKVEEPMVFPSTKKLTVSNPTTLSVEQYLAILELEKPQDGLKQSVEHVEVNISADMQEMLGDCVRGSSVECAGEPRLESMNLKFRGGGDALKPVDENYWSC